MLCGRAKQILQSLGEDEFMTALRLRAPAAGGRGASPGSCDGVPCQRRGTCGEKAAVTALRTLRAQARGTWMRPGGGDLAAGGDGNLRFLVHDLACVAGTLSEIATAWRRARRLEPGLALAVPLRPADAARQLAPAVRALSGAGPEQPPDLAVAGQLSALRAGIASAMAMTCGPGQPPIGDAKLREYLRPALHRAGNRLLTLILHQVKIRDWSLTGPAPAGEPDSGRAGLLIEFG